MQKILTFLLVALVSTIQLSAQYNITIKVVNSRNEPVPSGSITLRQVGDSSHIYQKVSDSLGTTIFTVPNKGLYSAEITSSGYQSVTKGITVKQPEETFTIRLTQMSKTLQGVTITATKPIMRQEDDKTIVDPEPLANSSTNGYEILEKTPGLFVDQDGNIYINSTTPATVYINGREQKMSAADIATMLKNLPPNAISSIEILRTPSAKYDASNSGGIVNVVLKKGVKIGLTGSVNFNANHGKYGNALVGLNVNNNNGKTSTYLNLQYGQRKSYEEIRTDRIYSTDSLLSQDAATIYPTTNYYLGYGVNTPLSKKWELSYDGRINYSTFRNPTINYSSEKKIGSDVLFSENTTNVLSTGNNFNLNQGLNGKMKIDSTGSEWTTDISYNYSPSTQKQDINTHFTKPYDIAAAANGNITTGLHVTAAQSNITWKKPKQVTLEAGVKSTLVWFNNNTVYSRQHNGATVTDESSTSTYKYNESIFAAFLQASKTISGITFKGGVRMEHTNMNGNQVIPTDTSFSINRTDFFPYVYISRKVMSIAHFELRAYLVYRRTITRPGYQLLNPSQRYIDEYLFETGNPALRPQFTTNYEANVSVDDRPIVAVGVNDTKDIFTNVVYQAANNHSVSYRTYDNLGSNREWYVRALGAIPPGKTYFFVVGFQYNHNLYNGLYETKPLMFDKESWTLFTYQTLKLGSLSQLSLHGFARFKGQQQFYELSPFGSLNMSINRQFMKKKLTVTASVADIFNTNHNDFTINQGSVNASGFRQSDTRRFGLNIRYSFGFRKKEENNMFNMETPEKTNP